MGVGPSLQSLRQEKLQGGKPSAFFDLKKWGADFSFPQNLAADIQMKLQIKRTLFFIIFFFCFISIPSQRALERYFHHHRSIVIPVSFLCFCGMMIIGVVVVVGNNVYNMH